MAGWLERIDMVCVCVCVASHSTSTRVESRTDTKHAIQEGGEVPEQGKRAVEGGPKKAGEMVGSDSHLAKE